MFLEVEMVQPEALSDERATLLVTWEILSFHSRTDNDTYIDHPKGKMYPLKKVIKNRRLQKKLATGSLLQIPTGTDFMVIREHHNSRSEKRCINLDMLNHVRNIRVIDSNSD